MRVDVVDRVPVDAAVLESEVDARGHPETVGVRVGHVVGVAGQSSSEILGQDGGAARLRVLQALHHEDSGTLTHDEPVTIFVPRPRCALGLITALRQGAAGHEPSESDRDDGGLRPSCEHAISVPIADVVRGGDEAVIGGGTCR